ncbi:MAG: transposase family protein [Bdellovibrionaceae bacterium]|nr:transposase family protein [Pseudobdellovibrionaceae bacterium]
MTDITKFHGSNLIANFRKYFSQVPDIRNPALIEYPLEDILMSGLSLFIMKFPSLLQFEEWHKVHDKNRTTFQNIFKCPHIPSDTRMREVLDEVYPKHLDFIFDKFFLLARKQKKINSYERLGGYYLVSLDGTGSFHSEDISCEFCLRTAHKGKNKVTYSHKFLTGTLVHPTDKIVLPLGVENITGLGEDNKKDVINDCEQNAFMRFLEKFHQSHPQLKTIILADALHANATVIMRLKEMGKSFILNIKPGKHKKLFSALKNKIAKNQAIIFEKKEELGLKVKKSVTHHFEIVNGVPLSANYLEGVTVVNYRETTEWISPKKVKKIETKKFSWVTDLSVTSHNAMEVMRAGRSRWQIENETFNTLKNGGYEFEHNYGHGNKNYYLEQ